MSARGCGERIEHVERLGPRHGLLQFLRDLIAAMLSRQAGSRAIRWLAPVGAASFNSPAVSASTAARNSGLRASDCSRARLSSEGFVAERTGDIFLDRSGQIALAFFDRAHLISEERRIRQAFARPCAFVQARRKNRSNPKRQWPIADNRRLLPDAPPPCVSSKARPRRCARGRRKYLQCAPAFPDHPALRSIAVSQSQLPCRYPRDESKRANDSSDDACLPSTSSAGYSAASASAAPTLSS